MLSETSNAGRLCVARTPYDGNFLSRSSWQNWTQRIPGLRTVPFDIKLPLQDAGSTVGWVGEGARKPAHAEYQ